MRGFQKLRTNLLMALGTGFVLKLPCRGDIRADGRVLLAQRHVFGHMDQVTVVAGNLIFLVAPRLPEREMPIAGMAFQTGLASMICRCPSTFLSEVPVRLRPVLRSRR